MLVAEATWVGFDRRVWILDLQHEAYRLIDLAVLVLLVALALGLPLLLVPERRRLPAIFAAIFVAGLTGAVGFSLLQRLLLHV